MGARLIIVGGFIAEARLLRGAGEERRPERELLRATVTYSGEPRREDRRGFEEVGGE